MPKYDKEHAKRLLKPLAEIDETATNSEAAAEGENREWTVTQPEFDRTTREEGFQEIRCWTPSPGEAKHEKRFAPCYRT